MRILLVEDTIDVGEAIVARFERIGHRVDWEKDGSVADEVKGSVFWRIRCACGDPLNGLLRCPCMPVGRLPCG